MILFTVLAKCEVPTISFLFSLSLERGQHLGLGLVASSQIIYCIFSLVWFLHTAWGTDSFFDTIGLCIKCNLVTGSIVKHSTKLLMVSYPQNVIGRIFLADIKLAVSYEYYSRKFLLLSEHSAELFFLIISCTESAIAQNPQNFTSQKHFADSQPSCG